MSLSKKITSLAEQHLTQDNDWYSWKSINTSLLPSGINLSGNNEYAQNVSLKQQLHKHWCITLDESRKTELTHYYISIWGGVRGNLPERIRHYAIEEDSQLIALGSKGIASWSKALCIRNPQKYAIFDARVSLSLNLLQLSDCRKPEFFPALVGQNRLINEATRKLKHLVVADGWAICPKLEFYEHYLDVLKEAAKRLDVQIYTLEMLLFSLAPRLYASCELMHSSENQLGRPVSK